MKTPEEIIRLINNWMDNLKLREKYSEASKSFDIDDKLSIEIMFHPENPLYGDANMYHYSVWWEDDLLYKSILFYDLREGFFTEVLVHLKRWQNIAKHYSQEK